MLQLPSLLDAPQRKYQEANVQPGLHIFSQIQSKDLAPLLRIMEVIEVCLILLRLVVMYNVFVVLMKSNAKAQIYALMETGHQRQNRARMLLQIHHRVIALLMALQDLVLLGVIWA